MIDIRKDYIRWILRHSNNTIVRALFSMVFSRFGIEFDYKGDWVWWVWPWRRTQTEDMAWISTSFEAGFSSLKELDEEWEKYFDACRFPCGCGNHMSCDGLEGLDA